VTTDRTSNAKDLVGLLKIEVSAANAWFEENEWIHVISRILRRVELTQVLLL
jgi:hypothetical protein